MFYRFSAEVPLRWVDVDSVGVVNNAVYMSFLEQARYLYFQHLGLMEDHAIPFLLAETKITFKKPGRLGMKIEVAARTSKIGDTSMQMDYEVRGNDEVLAKASAVLVFVDERQKPRAIPDDYRQAVAGFDDLAA